MANNYVIYMHKNKINNKVYIGQTNKAKASYRWGINGSGYKTQPKFYRAIKKYGWNNFEHIILEENIFLNNIDLKEQYYINKYNSIKNGYNCQKGGINKKPITNRKIVYQYDLLGNFIKKYNSILDAATILNIAPGSIVKTCKGELKSCGGFMWSYNKDINIKLERKTNAKKVYQYDMQGNLVKIFDSIKQAATEVGTTKSHICNCCKHKDKSALNFVWRYEGDPFSYTEDIYYTRQVIQYDLEGNEIKVWNSLADIYKCLNIRQGNIYSCCMGKRNTAGGYTWKYKEN